MGSKRAKRKTTSKRVGRRGSSPPARVDRTVTSRRRRRVVLALGLAGALGIAGLVRWRWRGDDLPRARGPGFNVLLITLDTTRADHLGCYGHPAIETPHVDGLAARGTTFTQCTAAAPITLPSHASLLTGTYPYVHGVRDNGQFQLSESNVTLAELLGRAGYATAGHVGAFVLNRGYGLAQGFDTYLDPRTDHERRADAVCDGAIAWLRDHHAEPFFVWTHFFDPHTPYDPPEPFKSRYDDPYVGEIAFVDQQVGRLVAELDRLGVRERTLIVLTADHGEGRGEHDEATHLYFVYDTTLHVPLILHCPGRIPAGRRVSAQTRLIDVVPTVLAFLEQPIKEDAQGEDLLDLIRGGTDDLGRAAYGETLGGFLAMGLSPLRCLRAGGWKYIHAPTPELYHVAEDPGETKNLAATEVQRRDEMRDRLETLIADAPPPPTDDTTYRPTGAEVQKLMGLGYVGGSGRGSPTDALPTRELDLFDPMGLDPKAHTKEIALQGDATHALLARDFARAEALLRQLRQVFANSPGISARLARALFQQGKDDEAIAIYRDMVADHPDYAEAYYGMGKLLARKKRVDDAIESFRKAIEADPTYAEAHYDLGVFLGKRGELEASIASYRTAVRLRPTYVDALFNLAAGLVRKEQFDAAINLYRRAIRLEPADPTIHFNLGNVFVRKGDLPEAARCYEAALRLRPDFAPAQASLRAVRKQLGQR